MQNQAKVSVVIPCYNGRPYLKEAIDSVLQQSLQDFELIYIDDQSTDGSFEIAQEYASRDKRIRVLRNEKNLGMVGNWNRCLEEARGEYVKLLCADDVIYKDCLAHQAAELDKNPEVSLVSSSSSVINSSSRHLLTRKIPQGTYSFEQFFSMATRRAANILGEPSITLMRRSCIGDVGLFSQDFRYGTDLEYWCRLLQGNKLLAITPGIEAGFRLHPGSLTNVHMTKGRDELARIFRKYADQDKKLIFDEPGFARQYDGQVKLKGLVIKYCESTLGRLFLNSADRLRSAFAV